MTMVATYATAGAALGISAASAWGCTIDTTDRPFWRTDKTEQCALTRYRPWGDTRVSKAERLSQTVVSQFVTHGVDPCLRRGHEVIVYYDCEQEKALTVSGRHWGMVGPVPDGFGQSMPDDDRFGLLAMATGPAGRFVAEIEPEFSPTYSIESMDVRASQLDWVTEHGINDGPIINLFAAPFDLACGCDLPQTGGN